MDVFLWSLSCEMFGREAGVTEQLSLERIMSGLLVTKSGWVHDIYQLRGNAYSKKKISCYKFGQLINFNR